MEEHRQGSPADQEEGAGGTFQEESFDLETMQREHLEPPEGETGLERGVSGGMEADVERE